eukprot:NODE_13045_length_489_cov_72.806011_g12752_i0.p1 GENE.NODE_13045_length_489_cov_72.806011_g12752_i0~~NODE_13045_length_489_cov_72.806011_g12752_i0.p1  ORF type:complete len:145 (-),score=20.99 NODE_13045_length_489_cov_72.806011_g12752_i0:5-439(-)
MSGNGPPTVAPAAAAAPGAHQQPRQRVVRASKVLRKKGPKPKWPPFLPMTSRSSSILDIVTARSRSPVSRSGTSDQLESLAAPEEENVATSSPDADASDDTEEDEDTPQLPERMASSLFTSRGHQPEPMHPALSSPLVTARTLR